MIGRIPILDISPVVECGRRPAKAVVGETFQVSATVFREGHGVLGAGVVLRDPAGRPGPLTRMRLLAPGSDRYGADVTVTSEGAWSFHVESWADPIAGWDHDAGIKIGVGQDVELMLTEGALLFGCSACSGFTSTQAISARRRSTRSVDSSISLSVSVSCATLGLPTPGCTSPHQPW